MLRLLGFKPGPGPFENSQILEWPREKWLPKEFNQKSQKKKLAQSSFCSNSKAKIGEYIYNEV